MGPDGSLSAGLYVDAGTDRTITVYDQSHSLSIGDWIIAGVWAKAPVLNNPIVGGTNRPGTPVVRLSTWSTSATGASFNGITPTDNGYPLSYVGANEDIYNDGRWLWFCQALKCTGVGTGTCEIEFILGSLAHYGSMAASWFFNPCMQLISASDNFTDSDVINMARSYRGGWSSNAKRGMVACLDHQSFQAGSFSTPKTSLTIASGVITASRGYHLVDTESAAASDDLDTINGGTDGMRLVIRAASSSRTVVIKDGTGNIHGPGDITLNSVHNTAELIFDSTLNNWLIVSNSNNG
jgi:hypothetical protein